MIIQKSYKTFLLFLLICFAPGCKNDCQKLGLTENEKSWIDHFKKGDIRIFENSKGQQDSLVVTDIRDFYTPCNQIELSRYQFQVKDVSFKLKSISGYNNSNSIIVFKRSLYEQRIPYIYFGNLGPFRKNIDNRLPRSIDTVLGGTKFRNIHYYGDELNTEQYGEIKYFKNFFWDKLSGLIAYTTAANDLYVRIDK